MKVSFFIIGSVLNEKEKRLVKVSMGTYKKIKKRLFVVDRRKNRGRKRKAMVYPVLKFNGNSYTVYSVVKQLRIEDPKVLMVENNKLFYR